jgi:hypothetical protein
MKKPFQIALVLSSVVLTVAMAAGAKSPVGILLEVEPGYNPAGLTYEKRAVVTFDGKRVARTTIDQSSATVTTEESLRKIKAGETLTVAATFSDPDGSGEISCTRTWTAIADQSIGCGPIEVGYQAYDGTCVLVCN